MSISDFRTWAQQGWMWSCLHLISYTLSIRHHTRVIQITYHHDGINKSPNFACISSLFLMNLMFQYRVHNTEHTGLNPCVYLYAVRTNWMFVKEKGPGWWAIPNLPELLASLIKVVFLLMMWTLGRVLQSNY